MVQVPTAEVFEIPRIVGAPGECLFHYTKLSTAIELILPTWRLKMNPFSKMRDPRESKQWGLEGHIEGLSERFGLPVANVFHAGDGNLHPLVCYDARKPGEAERAEELATLIIDACLGVGGSITGEHGVGVDKKASMTKMFSEADLDAFQRLRCAFDPGQLANPGKVMPAPRLCGEVPGPYRQHPIEAAGVASRL